MMSWWRKSAFSATSSDFPLARSATVPSSSEVFGGLWNWPRKKYSLKLEINSSLTRLPVQKPPDCYTATLNVIGPGYKSTLSTRRWLIGPPASSGSVCDPYTAWSGRSEEHTSELQSH